MTVAVISTSVLNAIPISRAARLSAEASESMLSTVLWPGLVDAFRHPLSCQSAGLGLVLYRHNSNCCKG